MTAQLSEFSGSLAYKKYKAAAPQTAHLTVSESEDLGRDLAALIKRQGGEFDLVVGLANGAFLPTKVVADTLGLPWHMVRVRRKGTQLKQRLLWFKTLFRIPPELILWGPFRALWVSFQKRTSALQSETRQLDFDVAHRNILLVDDCIETGISLKFVSEMLRHAGASTITTAVYCWADMPDIPEDQTRPDFFLHRGIQFYPWSNNSRYLDDFRQWMDKNGLVFWE